MATLEQQDPGWDAKRVAALIDPATPAQESPTLEFKRGEKLGRESKLVGALVKQVTGMANAGGGTILFGVAEGEVEGVTTAVGLSPIIDRKLDADWLASVVHGWTAPPLRNFKVTQVIPRRRSSLGTRTASQALQIGQEPSAGRRRLGDAPNAVVAGADCGVAQAYLILLCQ
jgi:hypothetical protein